MNIDNSSSSILNSNASRVDVRDEWQGRWDAVTYERLEGEIQLFQRVHTLLQNRWMKETKKYEKTIKVTIDDNWGAGRKTLVVPRRNYFNSQGIVQDPTLFPYHNSLYNLMDCYDRLNCANMDIIPLSADVIRFTPPTLLSENPFEFLEWDNVESPVFPSCSELAIALSTGCNLTEYEANYLQEQAIQAHYLQEHAIQAPSKFWFMISTNLGFHRFNFPHLNEVIDSDEWYAKVMPNIKETAQVEFKLSFGPEYLPRDRLERSEILLKLIRHSLSEMQRDFKLAAAVLTLMIRLRDLDDVTVLRKLLVVIDSEYFPCGKPCDHSEAVDHDCSDWSEFYRQFWIHVLPLGLSSFTQEHSLCLAGFVRHTFLREFQSYVPELNSNSVAGRRKSLLVRAVVSRQVDAEENDRGRGGDIVGKIPVAFIEALILSLGQRGVLERDFHFSSLNQSSSPATVDQFCLSLRSYQWIVWTLVSLAHSAVQLLPESEYCYGIASAIVQSLCRCFCEVPYTKAWNDLDGSSSGLRDRAPMPNNWDRFHVPSSLNIMAPLRYANHFLDSAAKNSKETFHIPEAILQNDIAGPYRSFWQEFYCMFDEQPRRDVLEAVQGLFLRNLVDVRESCVGYGDFLVWCEFEVTPLDPILFW
jgi:hypothetical protein